MIENPSAFVKFLPFPPRTFEERVHALFSFFDLFDYPLTVLEVESFLGKTGQKGSVLSLDERKQADDDSSGFDVVSFLEGDDRFEVREGFWFFRGRQVVVNLRKVRGAIAEAYWKKVRRFLPLSRAVPFVRMAAVCNTLAFNSPTSGSDIDLFFVARRGRIFTVRTFLTLLYTVLGVRRHGNKVAGRLCLSFFVTDDAMDLSGIRLDAGSDGSDPYLWFWMRTLIPLYGADCYREFAKINGFQAEDFFVSSASGKPLRSALAPRARQLGGGWRLVGRLWELVLGGRLGDILENWLRKKQLGRHEQRRPQLGENSSVIVSDTMLKYHNIDRRAELNKRFFERYNGESL